jgi:hypothetical protein
MAIPHKTARYEHLSKAVKLPPPKEVAAGAEGEARRARRRRG